LLETSFLAEHMALDGIAQQTYWSINLETYLFLSHMSNTMPTPNLLSGALQHNQPLKTTKHNRTHRAYKHRRKKKEKRKQRQTLSK
jgi:hypothetical protein